MKPFEAKDYKAFTMFEERWALVTAGTLDDFNTCTVSWGSMGNVWGPNGGDISTVTVYTQAGKDRWEPHYMYIGEVVEAIED